MDEPTYYPNIQILLLIIDKEIKQFLFKTILVVVQNETLWY